MILKKNVIDLINNVPDRLTIAKALGVSEQMTIGHIRANKPNGRLTRIDALLTIKEIINKPGRLSHFISSVEELVEAAAP